MNKRLLKLVVGWAVLVFMGLSAGYSLNTFGIRDRFPPPVDAAPVAGTGR